MSEQIISLTSSDEEENPEPPPKKKKTASVIVPQVTLSLVPKVKKNENPIETVTLDSDDEPDQPTAPAVNHESKISTTTNKVDLITLTDDEEDMQFESNDVVKTNTAVNALINSTLSTDTTAIDLKDNNSTVCLDKNETLSIIDSDSEPETKEKEQAQPTKEISTESTDTNENIITDPVKETAEEINEKNVHEVSEVIENVVETNTNIIEATDKEVSKETINGLKNSIEVVMDDKLLEENELENSQTPDNLLELNKVEIIDQNVDSIIIKDSDEETEKENHCENVDFEPFPVNMEKTSANDIPGPSLCSQGESVQAISKIFKKFLKIVEEKIVDSSFEEILPKKVPIIQKYFRRCGIYVKEKTFEKFLNESIECIKKAPNSSAANTAVLAFHKIFEHLKSHVTESTIEIEEEHLSKVKTLEKTIKLLRKKIRQLEEAEVNFDDDEDSAYIMLDRYQARLNKVYVKYCEYIRRNPYSGRAIYDKISFVNSQYNVINQAISRKYKNSVTFPSYYELEKYIEKIAKKEKLELSVQEIKRESKNCFKHLGTILQKKRRQELYDSHLDFIEFTEDPAAKDISLENVLRKNYSEGKDKIEKLYQKYVNKQEQGEDHVSSDEGETSEASDSEENNKMSSKRGDKNMKKGKRKSKNETEENENDDQANGIENYDKEDIGKTDSSLSSNIIKECIVEVQRIDEELNKNVDKV